MPTHRILVLILTSYDVYLAERCVRSVLEQWPYPFLADLKVVVNSKDPHYHTTLQQHLQQQLKEQAPPLIETESNGRPGKGHNSLLTLFRQHEDYDYLITIDGDDLFYPCAFQQLGHALSHQPDILQLMVNDSVSLNNKPGNHVPLAGQLILNTTRQQRNEWQHHTLPNPWADDLNTCSTPARLLLFSRRVLHTSLPIHYDEQCGLYDDYIAFISACEAHYRNELRIFTLSSRNIYLYNATNLHSVTRNLHEREREHRVFHAAAPHYRTALQALQVASKAPLDLSGLPWLALPEPADFDMQSKGRFCMHWVVRFEYQNTYRHIRTALNVKDYPQAEKLCWILLDFGLQTPDLLTAIGDTCMGLQRYSEALDSYQEAVREGASHDLGEKIHQAQQQLA